MKRKSRIEAIVEALIAYADNYAAELGSDDYSLGEDGYCGDYWLQAASAASHLLSGPGDFDGGKLDHALRACAERNGFSKEESDEI